MDGAGVQSPHLGFFVDLNHGVIFKLNLWWSGSGILAVEHAEHRISTARETSTFGILERRLHALTHSGSRSMSKTIGSIGVVENHAQIIGAGSPDIRDAFGKSAA